MSLSESNLFSNWNFSRTLGSVYHNWDLEEIRQIMLLPLNDLIFYSQYVHRLNHKANEIQVSTLCSIKTGGCAEDCSYCSQSSRYESSVVKEKLMAVEDVLEQARQAKEAGATRFCMGAAWRNPSGRQFSQVVDMVKQVRMLGLETCATLGMLDNDQANLLADAGLDYYNHNLDTSEAYYPQVITTRTFQDRLDTLDSVRQSGIKVCSGGIIGMGEEQIDRAQLLQTFANLEHHPESVPINLLVPIEGTPLYKMRGKTDAIEFVRVIATARIVMPKSMVRLSAGRNEMSEEMQALCFSCGANSIFYGDKLLTTDNPEANNDKKLFKKLGLRFAETKITDLTSKINETFIVNGSHSASASSN